MNIVLNDMNFIAVRISIGWIFAAKAARVCSIRWLVAAAAVEIGVAGAETAGIERGESAACPSCRQKRALLTALYVAEDDITAIVKEFVARGCYEFIASNLLAGDPCENVTKSLIITFDDGYVRTFHEGETVIRLRMPAISILPLTAP